MVDMSNEAERTLLRQYVTLSNDHRQVMEQLGFQLSMVAELEATASSLEHRMAELVARMHEPHSEVRRDRTGGRT